MSHPWDLTKQGTVELLYWLNACRRCGGAYDPTGNHGPLVPEEEIRAELAKRPHIPNKLEARKRRQMRAKYRKTRYES